MSALERYAARASADSECQLCGEHARAGFVLVATPAKRRRARVGQRFALVCEPCIDALLAARQRAVSEVAHG